MKCKIKIYIDFNLQDLKCKIKFQNKKYLHQK